jgi:hypothetical protein
MRRLEERWGRFFIRKKTRFEAEFYCGSGVEKVGTPDEQEFIQWTRYIERAQGFDSMKSAQNVALMIRDKYGVQTYIIQRR